MTEFLDPVPPQYREGKTNFMGMEIAVDPRVLIPRPETELLVEVVFKLCREKAWDTPLILDICTGSGAVSLGLTKVMADCEMIGSDISEDALDVAKTNVENLGQRDRVRLVRSDMFEVFRDEEKKLFDAIVSNPPYVSEDDYPDLDEWVKAEPMIALHGGVEGMEYLNILVSEGKEHLKDGGFIALEVGYDQSEKVKTLFEKFGFEDIKGFRDFNGYDRVIVGWKHG